MERFRVELGREALDDLADIRDHIADDRGRAFANQFVARILDHLSRFETGPLRGKRRDDIRPGLRVVGWRRMLTIAFAVHETEATVIILAVLYRGRDVDGVLKLRGDR